MYTQHPILTEKNWNVDIFANLLKKEKLKYHMVITIIAARTSGGNSESSRYSFASKGVSWGGSASNLHVSYRRLPLEVFQARLTGRRPRGRPRRRWRDYISQLACKRLGIPQNELKVLRGRGQCGSACWVCCPRDPTPGWEWIEKFGNQCPEYSILKTVTFSG